MATKIKPMTKEITNEHPTLATHLTPSLPTKP